MRKSHLKKVSFAIIATLCCLSPVTVMANSDYTSSAASTIPFAKTLKSLSVDKPKVELEAGKSDSVVVTATFSDKSKQNVTDKVVWTNPDSSIATIEKGAIKAIKAGQVKLKGVYTSGKIKKTVYVTVTVKGEVPAGGDILSKYSATPPTLDGKIADNEWGEPLISTTLTYKNKKTDIEESHAMKAYFLNDDTYQYIAVKIEDEDLPQGKDYDKLHVWFDNNANQLIEVNEDIKTFENFTFENWKVMEDESWGAIGSDDGSQGAATHTDGDYIYECKIPLSIFTQDHVGMKITYAEMYDQGNGNSTGKTVKYPDGDQFDGKTYAKLIFGKK